MRDPQPIASIRKLYTNEPDPSLVSGLAVISDPTRLRILAALRDGHKTCKDIKGYAGIHVSDIANHIGMSQPAISQHLARLRQVGLVVVTKKGQFAYYLRDEAALDALRSAIATI